MRNQEVKAAYVSVDVDIDYYAPSEEAIDYKKDWDAHIDAYNVEASLYAKDAWHTSSLWVRAEAQAALISSTIVTVALVVVLAFIGMLVFTRDQRLSLMVVGSTLQVISGLTWFITVVMGWPIGAIEVIALIVFIGYAVTYSLHIAHRYGAAESLEWKASVGDNELTATRYKRTAFALASIGGAALGSAVTTAGCSIFLLFCTLTIFQKLGGVVLAVTIMSILAALIPLPGALLLVGPKEPGNCWCMRPRETFHKFRNIKATLAEAQEKRKQEALKQRTEYERLKKEKDEKKKLEKAEKDVQKQQAAEEKAKQKEEEARKKAEEKAAKEAAKAAAAAAAQEAKSPKAADAPSPKAKSKGASPKSKAAANSGSSSSLVDLDADKVGSGTPSSSSSKKTRSAKPGESKSAVVSGASSSNPALAALKPTKGKSTASTVAGNSVSGLSLPGVSSKTPPSSGAVVSAPRQDSKFSDSDFDIGVEESLGAQVQSSQGVIMAGKSSSAAQ